MPTLSLCVYVWCVCVCVCACVCVVCVCVCVFVWCVCVCVCVCWSQLSGGYGSLSWCPLFWSVLFCWALLYWVKPTKLKIVCSMFNLPPHRKHTHFPSFQPLHPRLITDQPTPFLSVFSLSLKSSSKPGCFYVIIVANNVFPSSNIF